MPQNITFLKTCPMLITLWCTRKCYPYIFKKEHLYLVFFFADEVLDFEPLFLTRHAELVHVVDLITSFSLCYWVKCCDFITKSLYVCCCDFYQGIQC